MKKRKHIWQLSQNQITKLRKEIVLNSLFLSDYENSFGLDAQEVCDYFSGYFDYLWENAEPSWPKHADDSYKIQNTLSTDSKENLILYHMTFDRV